MLLQNLLIIKKDGRKQNFDGNKIEIAVKKSYLSLLRKNKITKDEYTETIFNNKLPEKIRFDIEFNIEKLDNATDISVSYIHDLVEKELCKYSYQAAKEYIIYRNCREQEREREILVQQKKNIIDSFSDRASNANMDENTFSGKENVILEDRMEKIALYAVLNDRLSYNHLTRRLYYHDLNKFGLGQHNCSYPDFPKLLDEGMYVGQGDIKPPKHFEPMMQLLAVIIQLQSQIQFGGCGIAALDFLVQKYLEYLVSDLVKETYDILDIDHEVPKRVKLSELNEYLTEKQSKKLIKRFERQIHQSCEALITNLVTLQSRAGKMFAV